MHVPGLVALYGKGMVALRLKGTEHIDYVLGDRRDIPDGVLKGNGNAAALGMKGFDSAVIHM